MAEDMIAWIVLEPIVLLPACIEGPNIKHNLYIKGGHIFVIKKIFKIILIHSI